MGINELKKLLQSEVHNSRATVSALWQPLGAPPLFSHDAKRRMISASMIKVPILTAALEKVLQGQAAMDTLLTVKESDILEDSQAFETGPRQATLEELLTWMITLSDNTSTNILLDWLSMEAVNRHCAVLDMPNTVLQRRMLDFEAIKEGRNNYTSAADMYTIFRALYEDAILTPALCAVARHILEKQRSSLGLRRYIWQDAGLASKTGGLENLSHDAGVFTLGAQRWFLGVFVQDAPDVNGDQKLIGRIAKEIFSYYQEEKTKVKYAVVQAAVAPLYTHATTEGELADEALHGMVVEILGRPLPGWAHVRTHYRYEGYTPESGLLLGDDRAQHWQNQPKMVVTAPCLDVMKQALVQAPCWLGIPRGAVVCPVGPVEDGWQQVCLPSGECGYVKAAHLGEYICNWSRENEPALRRHIVDTALAYLGAQYRWGGKTPAGIDCSGLAAMAYLLNGCIIYRDAAIKEGFDLREITLEEIKPGDLLFFPGHVAIYMGDGDYIHATGHTGDDGVVLNSLRPGHPRYREDLHKSLTKVGSIF